MNEFCNVIMQWTMDGKANKIKTIWGQIQLNRTFIKLLFYSDKIVLFSEPINLINKIMIFYANRFDSIKSVQLDDQREENENDQFLGQNGSDKCFAKTIFLQEHDMWCW